MSEITWILDEATGEVLVEGFTAAEASNLVGDLLRAGREVGCARPVSVLPPPVDPDAVVDGPTRLHFWLLPQLAHRGAGTAQLRSFERL